MMMFVQSIIFTLNDSLLSYDYNYESVMQLINDTYQSTKAGIPVSVQVKSAVLEKLELLEYYEYKISDSCRLLSPKGLNVDLTWRGIGPDFPDILKNKNTSAKILWDIASRNK